MAIFCGQAALALAIVGAWRWRLQRRGLLLLTLLALALVIALGGNTPLFEPLTRICPPMLKFRAPVRAWALGALTLAMLAGAGLEQLRGWARRRRGAFSPSGLTLLLVGLELIGLAWFRFGLAGERFTSADVLRNRGIERWLEPGDGGTPGRLFRLVDELPYTDTSRAGVVARLTRLQPDANALRGVRVARGYDEGMLPTIPHALFLARFWRNFYSSNPDTLLLGLCGIQYLLADKPVEPGDWIPLAAPGGLAIYENPDYRGEAFTPAHWPEVDWDPLRVPFVERLALGDVAIDLTRAAQPGDDAAPAVPPPPLVWSRPHPGRIDVELPADFAGPLLISEGWMPGWEAELEDGRSVEARPVNAALLSFEIPTGARRVSVRYRPASVRRGLALGLAGLAGLLGLWLAGRRRAAPPQSIETEMS
jgi:hypothetical protein